MALPTDADPDEAAAYARYNCFVSAEDARPVEAAEYDRNSDITLPIKADDPDDADADLPTERPIARALPATAENVRSITLP
jgi:hypothetical protein